MDKNKQPGIQIKAILFSEVTFKRNPSTDIEPNIDVSYEINNILNNKNELQVHFKTTITEEKKENPLKIELLAVGIFASVGGEENLALDEFCRYNAPSIIFPYIREYVSSLSIKAGLDPIVLPPTNFIALTKEKKLPQKIKHSSLSKKKI